MLEFKTETFPHIDGNQVIYTFDNGFSASVIPEYDPGLFTGRLGLEYKAKPGFYEMMVRFNEKMCKCTPITNGEPVRRMIHESEIYDLLIQIANFNGAECKCSK